MSKPAAIALMSGGLDSNLAVRLLHDMGIPITGVHFTGPFCLCNRGTGGCIHYARKIADELGIEFSTQSLGAEYLDIVVHPKHGRGSGMNPCLDCRILMFKKAKLMMQNTGAFFIVTGEVLGQRPMSQLREKLRTIERKAELEGLILRPLSAHCLPPTIPEKEGWVNRDALLAIHGRGRREQMDLAEKLQLGDYPCPAGGCLLTDKHFAARLREHIEHTGGLEMCDISLLKIGRHFRLPSGLKIVLGRDQQENERLEQIAGERGLTLRPESGKGPVALLHGRHPSDDDLQSASEILAAYCTGDGPLTVVGRSNGKPLHLDVDSKDRSCFAPLKI